MRVTNKMIASTFITNMNRNASRLEKYTEQLSTGKAISRPSDDPAATAKTLILQRSVNETDQYIKNLDSAKSWFEATDTAFNEIGNILSRVRELTVAGANDSGSQVSKDALAGEINQLKQQLLEVVNTSHEGKYIFATRNITEKPFADNFSLSLAEPEEITSRNIEIAPSITMDLNSSAKSLFMRTIDSTTVPPTEHNLFTELEKLATSISLGETNKVSASLEDMDKYIDQFLEERVKVGAKSLRIDNTVARYQNERMNLIGLLSKTSDIDIAETMVQYKMQETAYQASLMSGNKMMNISLLDFMR